MMLQILIIRHMFIVDAYRADFYQLMNLFLHHVVQMLTTLYYPGSLVGQYLVKVMTNFICH